MRAAGFEGVNVEEKQESAEFIKDWMPGSGAEKYVTSAYVTGTKPGPSTSTGPSASTVPPNTSTEVSVPTLSALVQYLAGMLATAMGQLSAKAGDAPQQRGG